MAVLSTVQHPNIVQMYACLTDVVEVFEGEQTGAGGRGALRAQGVGKAERAPRRAVGRAACGPGAAAVPRPRTPPTHVPPLPRTLDSKHQTFPL
jgi:hypothetical protein